MMETREASISGRRAEAGRAPFGSKRCRRVLKQISSAALRLILSAGAVAVLQVSSPVEAQATAEHRTIALTFDDLPAMSGDSMNALSIAEMNKKILATLRAASVPSIGFVNEIRLYKTGEADARIAVLDAWLDAGFDLGNHTYSHTSLNQAELRDWEDDVVQGESVTRILLTKHGKTLRYLRYPYLHTGPDLATRRAAEAFLTGRGYRVAPVTIDPLDWYFADLYEDARAHGDAAGEAKLAEAWLQYTAQAFAWGETRSRALLGYEPKQVLLLHDTWLEADHLGDLLALIKARGYGFVSLDEALQDPAYAQPDEYVSDVGATSIEHWAVTRGRMAAPGEAPQLPEWVRKRHEALDAADAK